MTKNNSRKWKLVLLILLIATIGTFIPPILSVWFLKMSSPLVILTGGHFVTLTTLVISAYLGANVTQKHLLKNNKIDSSVGNEEITTTIKKNEEGEA